MVTVVQVIDRTQLGMVLVGLVANILTVVTLYCNGRIFSPAILSLLRHQSGIDAWVCFITALMLIQPPMWVSGNSVVDLLLCQVWHSQATYWMAMFVSIWNLVAISFERYLAVCHPFKHGDFTPPKVRLTIWMIYVTGFVAMFPCYLQVRLADSQCAPEYAIPGKAGQIFYYGYSVFCFMVLYAIPCTMFFALYGLVIFAFRRRNRDSNMASSRTIDRATTELTKTAVVVTVIFIIALGYDCWYYLLGYTGVVVYIKNSFIQKVGIFFASFNSVCNPFVYALLMPAYRVSVKQTLCLRRFKMENDPTSSTSSTNVSVSN